MSCALTIGGACWDSRMQPSRARWTACTSALHAAVRTRGVCDEERTGTNWNTATSRRTFQQILHSMVQFDRARSFGCATNKASETSTRALISLQTLRLQEDTEAVRPFTCSRHGCRGHRVACRRSGCGSPTHGQENEPICPLLDGAV